MWILSAVVYAVVCSAAVLQQTHHFELIELAVRCAILLPALVLALRSRAPATAWSPPPWRAVAIPFAIAAALVSFALSRGILEPDESAYRFQARIFASGHLMAEPLPGAAAGVRQTPPALYYEHHILTPRGWMTKYYPGWPLALVPFAALNLDWLLNPLLSLLLLGFTYALARRWFDERTGRYAVLLLALSPFFLMLSVGSLSDMFCSVLVAGAWLGLARLAASKRPADHALAFLAAALACIVVACLTRPFTGCIVGVCFAVALVALLYANRRLLARSIAIGADFAVLACVLFLGYNYAVTGNAATSPYAASKGIAAPTEISLHPADMLSALIHHARPALQSTVVNVFPFLFLLAGFEVWRRRRDPRVWTLAPLFPALVIFHLLMPEPIAIHNGERYYAEGFFAVAILAAAAINRGAPSRSIAVTFVAVQLVALPVSIPALYRLAEPYIEVRKTIENLPAATRLVFLRTAPGYSPFWLNMNRADWKNSPTIYLIDPGNIDSGNPDRAKIAAQFGRPNYTTITYDAGTHTARAF